ncbi:hypothetical protein FQ775_16205 [Nitratireductor mangrovi]|uniref:Uncharacterized protein n=1 Tax=Nitratireductor mangrovi TaxID=2599600 RepID=A0A5B8L274_9HYPH|nr:hypothetical protein [Nitratireductor mangrovi]QDZ01792.1 hypothetical protein FQ775_16205 [Nitratireductor mangrovi]
MLTKAIRGAAALLISSVALMPAQGWTQILPRGPCGDRDSIVEWLDERHGESQSGFGLAGDRALLELFTSVEGTWTILLSGTTGRSCLMAAGTSWTDVEPPIEDTAQPAGDR